MPLQNARLERPYTATEPIGGDEGGSSSRLVNITESTQCNQSMEQAPMVKSRRALAALISVSALFGPFVAHSQTLTRLHAFTG